MVRKYKNHTLKEYLDVLSKRTPVPGGGSAAALTGALGVSLLCMVSQYSLNKGKSKRVESKLKKNLIQSQKIRNILLELVDLDAKAYLKLSQLKKASAVKKNLALKEAARIPKQVSLLCYKALDLAPLLVKEGNKYLLSDVKVATELLYAAFNSSVVLSKSK